MTKTKTLLTIGLLAMSVLIVQTAQASFADVSSSHTNYDAIAYVQSNGIVNGYSDGTFRPDDTINRAEFTKIIIEASFTDSEIESCLSDNTENSWRYVFFPDVEKGKWYTPYVCLAKMKGVVNGYSDNTFRPANSINLAEAAKIITEAFGYSVGSDDIWYKPYVDQLASLSAIPTTLNNFSDAITRGEMAEMIYRIKTSNKSKSSLTYDDLARTTGSVDYDDSPFGIAPINYEIAFDYIDDLGFKTIRLAGMQALIWDKIKTNGWSENDAVLKETSENFEISIVVLAGNPVESNQLDEYYDFLAEASERYDGDGYNDANGSPVITYWEIDNEPDYLEKNEKNTPWKGELEETEDYALILKTAYKAIKSSNPNAKVSIAGMAFELDYYEEILKELEKLKENSNDKFFDVFNSHYYGAYTDFGEEILFESGQGGASLLAIKSLLEEYGYGDIEIILTEAGTYQGEVRLANEVFRQSQEQQAGSLLKRFVYPISKGVSKIYWVGMEKSGLSYFDKMALIYGGEKTLAFYTYKLMVEKLEGSIWNNIEKIQESNDIYVYKFSNNGKSIWVAWSDSGSQTISLNVGNLNSIKITEAVPKYETGKEVINYDNAFTVETKTVSGDKVTITLEEIPIFIEGN